MTWAKLPTGLRVSIVLMLTAIAGAVGIAWGLSGSVEPMMEAQLDAIPFRTGLLAAIPIGMILAFLLPVLRPARARCLMAIQGLLLISLGMSGVHVITPFQVLIGALLISVLGVLALGRFEPKTPERRP